MLEVARELIGCTVDHAGTAGVIVETEAYHESEPACHAFVGLTPRTSTLFGPPGRAYVYRSYGIHALLNAVCEPEGVGAAVLIRALEPCAGLEAMRARRGAAAWSRGARAGAVLGARQAHPGARRHAGRERQRPRSRPRPGAPRLGPTGSSAPSSRGPRIGITRAVELPWRFCVAGNPNVSRPRPEGWGDVVAGAPPVAGAGGTARQARLPARARAGPRATSRGRA